MASAVASLQHDSTRASNAMLETVFDGLTDETFVAVQNISFRLNLFMMKALGI
jgi:hypothetical protein